MIRSASVMIASPLVRKARLYAKLNGLPNAEVVLELALAKFLATDPRIMEADAVLEQHKAQAWRELEEAWTERDKTL